MENNPQTNKKKLEEHSHEELVELVKKLKRRKKYGLMFEAKSEKVVERCKTELPILVEHIDKAIVDDDSKNTNVIIQGDNYHALSVLNYTHSGRIDLIYIDPPYNTGNKDFMYNDRYVEKDDNFKHSQWLSFMAKRLELSKNLLTKKGAIFISIDDNEYAQLKLLCDSVFGEENFINTVCVKMSHLSGVKMSHIDKKLPKLKEYLLIYAKNKNALELLPVYEDADIIKSFDRYKSFIIKDTKRPDDISKWKVVPLKKAMLDLGFDSTDQDQITDFYMNYSNQIFRTARNKSEMFLGLPNDTLFRKIETATGLKKLAYRREEVVFVSSKMSESDSKLKQPLGDIWLDIGINNLHNEGGIDFKNGKKPLRLIERIIGMTPSKNSLILDFFAGSGTTGEATLNMNELDGGDRQFILVTNNENKIAEQITYKRIKNTIDNKQHPISLRYFETAFVAKNNVSDDTRRELVRRSVEMICVRENTFTKKYDNKDYKIYTNGKISTGVIFDLDSIEEFKEKIEKLKLPARIYVFSLSNDTYESDFADLEVRHKLCAIPESILEVYRKLFI